MNKTKEMVKRVKSLMEEGKSLETAIEIAAEELIEGLNPSNRIDWIKGLTNISEVRKAIHRAHAKKSKSKDKEKYEKEIEAGYERLNELLAEADKSENPIKAMLEGGEEPSKVLHHWLRDKENEIKRELDQMKVSNNKRKELINKQPTNTPKCLIEELRGIAPDLVKLYQDRVTRKDQGVLALNRKTRLLGKK